MSDRSTIVNSMALTGAMVTGATLTRGRLPGIRPAVGLAITSAVLLSAADSTPGAARLARQFSVVIATTATLTAGGILASAVTRWLRTDTASTTTAPLSARLTPVELENRE